MVKPRPFPIPLELLSAIKSKYNIESDDEANQIDTIRRFLDDMAGQTEVPKVNRQDFIIVRNNINVNISILRPPESKDKVLPVILFLHGGGWVSGTLKMFETLTNQLVEQLQASVVFVHYSLSPEVKYPVALEECYTALCWIQDNANAIHVDIKRLAVCGDSAGGNLAAALSILAKDRGNASISYQVLYYPSTSMDYESESYNEHKDDELLSKVYMKYFWDAYLGNENNATLPTVTPLSASVESLKGLPPALIITAEIDVLRTEGELYAKKLMEAGVDTLCVRYNGAQHGFVTEPGYEAEAALAISQTVDVLKRRWNLK